VPLKILSVIGTRPEAVKMAPVVAALEDSEGIQAHVLVTAQHRQLLDEVLGLFDITPDYDLDVMSVDQAPSDVFAQVVESIRPVLTELQPDWMLVQGDTTTVLAATLAAAYHRVLVGHVEAGLRTYDRSNPFPEELNRVLTDHAASLHFAPTENACRALLREGISENTVHVTGNTVIDALQVITARRLPHSSAAVLASVPEKKRLILVTAHRRENFGAPLQRIIAALLELAHRDDTHIVYPVHPNPSVDGPVRKALGGCDNISLLPPLDYLTFAHLMKRAHLILTDSGGIQEEAPGLGVPVLVMRSVTERPEAIDAGTAALVGAETEKIVAATIRLLEDKDAHQQMAQAVNPFGNGRAAQKIVRLLLQQYQD
jgi:UDP-N-acetylglucosamine 2-epimerase (non-hydrolysing)